jgi:MFS family permease
MAWAPEPSARRRRSSELWTPILASGLIMGMALGARHVQGLFLLPVTMDRRWSRETFALAMAVQNLTWGIAQPFAGMIADRFGSTKVIAAGLSLYSLGLLGMMLATKVPFFALTAGICIGVAQAGTTFGVSGKYAQLPTQPSEDDVLDAGYRSQACRSIAKVIC